jgi:methionine sulfoxide reductase heme-binding subunit
MTWLRRNWRWAGLNGFGVFVMIVVLERGSLNWNATGTFDPMLESGKWAIRFLLVCLAMTPMNTYFGWRSAIKLRKPAGLWAFGFAALHFLLLITDQQSFGIHWLTFPLQPFIAVGLLGLVILTALAVTSHRWAMKRLGKYWKRLHRLVYLAGGAVVYHAMLASVSSKKVWVRDPQSVGEMKVYAVALAVLLVVRIPLVRSLLISLKHSLKHIGAITLPRRHADPAIIRIMTPDELPGQAVYRESQWEEDAVEAVAADSALRFEAMTPEAEIESGELVVN